MNGPTFLVIGAQKSGTTWLERNLAAHPNVGTPHYKELHYFDKADIYAKGREWYESCFPRSAAIKATGEFTPNYFWIPADREEAAESGQMGDIPRRIHALYPDIRLILTLRNPVERAISAYYHHMRARRIGPQEAIADVWHRFGIRSMGEYGRQLEEWMRSFPPDQFLLIHYEEEILRNPRQTYARVCRFLGVDPDFVPSGLERRRNPRNSHFLLHLNHRLPPLARLIQKYRPAFGSGWERFQIEIDPAAIETLRNHYASDIIRLEHLTARKLKWD